VQPCNFCVFGFSSKLHKRLFHFTSTACLSDGLIFLLPRLYAAYAGESRKRLKTSGDLAQSAKHLHDPALRPIASGKVTFVSAPSWDAAS
jgi:hypothetical protein